MSGKFTGGCLCGAIRYECTSEMKDMVACHCTDCQKASGAGVSHNAVVTSDSVRIVTGEPRVFEKRVDSGRTLRRSFCGDCGSPLFTQRENTPQVMSIRVGTLDDSSDLRIAMHIWTRSQRPWVHRDDSLPSHEENRPS